MANNESAPQTATKSPQEKQPFPSASKAASSPEKNGPKSPEPKDSHPGLKTDYIEPQNRRLGPHKDALNEPYSSRLRATPVNFQFRKIVGLLIASGKHQPKFTSEFLDEATELASQFMSYFVDSLHKLTEVQRHQRPGIADLEMCLEAQNVSAGELYSEYIRTKGLDPEPKRHAARISGDLQSLLRAYNAGNYTLEKDDPSLVFHANDQHEIASLVPRQAKPREYIPSYLPDLPPDFTFTSTGDYMHTTTDLKQIKLRLAEESRLNEASLYKLIDDDERRWKQAFERDLEALSASEPESMVDDIMSPAEVVPGSGLGSPESSSLNKEKSETSGTLGHSETSKNSGNSEKPETMEKPETLQTSGIAERANSDLDSNQTAKTGDGLEIEERGPQSTTPATSAASNHSKTGKEFDFVAFARNTRAARERYAIEMARRRLLRENNVFMKAEKVFSPYATAPASASDRKYFADVLDLSFKRVIKATRAAEQAKQKRLVRLAEERRKREEELGGENGAFEFGFAFNPASNISDDSDDEERAHISAEFDFGDSHDPKANSNVDSINSNVDSNSEESATQLQEPPAKIQPSSSSNEITMEDVGISPVKSGQVSGKAPLKGPVNGDHPTNKSQSAGADGQSELEDELDQHFGDAGVESGDLGPEFTMHFDETGSDAGDLDMDLGLEEDSADVRNGGDLKMSRPTAQVSWGDALSEESEEEELEDIE